MIPRPLATIVSGRGLFALCTSLAVTSGSEGGGGNPVMLQKIQEGFNISFAPKNEKCKFLRLRRINMFLFQAEWQYRLKSAWCRENSMIFFGVNFLCSAGFPPPKKTGGGGGRQLCTVHPQCFRHSYAPGLMSLMAIAPIIPLDSLRFRLTLASFYPCTGWPT